MGSFRMHSTILLSGGIDSAACVLALRDRCSVSAVFVDYGQAAAREEGQAAKRVAGFFGIPLITCEAHGRERLGTGELPGRNAFLIMAALLLGGCKPGTLVIGIHAGTPYYDCSPAFYELVSRIVAEQTNGNIQLLAPVLEWHKPEIAAKLRESNFPFELTYSCEAGGAITCGKCLSCLDRLALNI
jgi:7-cyano-7-deazaguanine synthase